MANPERSIEPSHRALAPRKVVPFEQVRARIVHFLEHYLGYPLVEQDFIERIAGASGEERFASLLEQAGFGGNPDGFIEQLVQQLESLGADRPRLPRCGEIQIPYQLALAVLELLVPGREFKTVKRVSQLEQLANIKVPAGDRESLQQVLDLYPSRLSQHTLRQMRLSGAISAQYLPFVEELDPQGERHTWVGQFHRGIVEQMYPNRVIFIMNMTCPVYCRFCFRKHKECRGQRAPTEMHVRQAVAYIKEAPGISEIVLTGGDPFMNPPTLRFAVQELAKIPHVKILRLASRAVSYYPDLFLKGNASWLTYLIKTNLELNQKGKQIELATHFVHPDEISSDSLYIISHLVKNGVPVYVQTPFVRGCNHEGPQLVSLFSRLRAVGAEMHYIFMPTSPIQGNKVYWTPISKGLETARYLRAHLSDRCIPHITTATSIGKIDWNSSGWAVEPNQEKPGTLWIRTPYTLDYFATFAPIMQLSDKVRSNAEGTLDALFYSDIGDESLFIGPRGLSSSPEAHEHKIEVTRRTVQSSLESLQAACLDDQRQLVHHVGRPLDLPLVRRHKTLVEMDAEAGEPQLERMIAYLRSRPDITDAVLSKRKGVFRGFQQTLDLIDRLQAVPHLLAIRLRCLAVNYAPVQFARTTLARLASRNRLGEIPPRRIEVEVQFLHSSELKPEHDDLMRQLRFHGITVYNNTPLLGCINDNAEEILAISDGCRALSIEFNNVYVAGLPFQEAWNRDHPVDPNSVIDIATTLRRRGSGRQLPRYLVATRLGEVDFSIAPPIFSTNDSATTLVTLRPHDLDYFRSIDPEFSWPEDVQVDEEGHPQVPVEGICIKSTDFLEPTTSG